MFTDKMSRIQNNLKFSDMQNLVYGILPYSKIMITLLKMCSKCLLVLSLSFVVIAKLDWLNESVLFMSGKQRSVVKHF